MASESKIKLSPTDRYVFTSWYIDSIDLEYFSDGKSKKRRDIIRTSTCNFPDIPYNDVDGIKHRTNSFEEGKMSNIAYIYYGDIELFWAIAYENDIADPIWGFRPGDVLKIPSLIDINETFVG